LKTAIDTSVVVAAVLGWHEHHVAARVALAATLRADAVVPTRVLVESYAVLTRLPAPHRLSPRDAFAVLDGTLRDVAALAALPPPDHWHAIGDWASRGVAGGSSYDAEVAITAARAGATRLLTFNVRHFERVAPPGLEIAAPAPARS